MPNSVQPPWTAAHQAPLSTGFSRHELWSGLPFSSPTWYMIPMHFTMMKHSCIPGKMTLVYIVQILLYEFEDGGGIGRGDHFLSYKFTERTTEW